MARGGPRGGGGGGGKKGGLGAIPGVAFVLTALAALVLPLWILAFLGWCVQVAGLAAVQYSQGRHFVMFDWFITVFELVVLLAMPGYLLARRCTPGIVALKAVVTVLEILRTNVWNNARLGRNDLGVNYTQVDSVTNPGLNASRTRVEVLFAGYLITSFFNILVLIALGNLPSASAQDAEYLENKGKQAAGAHDNDQHHHQPAAEPFSSTAVAVAGPNETVTTVTQGPIYPGEHGAHRV
ncbi:hypothetical protein WJX84_001456 [Apatococcus fuscideae]|uniref:Uncharacterized protein n=1 Tax=Apatococcus fuscideae TaxID=2026836 RepID=A0AAW1SQC3_9CHLO